MKNISEDLLKEGFKKVEMGETWDFTKNKIMRGYFVGMEEGIGTNNSNLYTFRTKKGDIVTVWGSAILDIRLKNVESKEEVVITYKGKATSEKTGRTYKDYDVYHKPINETAEFEKKEEK